MTLERLLHAWRSEPTVAGCVAAWESLPARPVQFLPFPDDLHPLLADMLHKRGVHALYTHQAQAWEHVRSGRHTAIVTGTASGKSLCYALPVLHSLLQDPQARALALFPTKALAQDQLGMFNALLAALPTQEGVSIPVAPYDGDTPSAARKSIRAAARLVLSNPDMLHTGILPHHTAWAEFFHGLRYVILDEIHTYRGVFGSHIANVLRRLKRIARFYGASPQFLLTSATIANPAEHASRLIEADVAVVDQDGSPRGPRHFLIYNPPVVNPELGLRRSALHESVRLAGDLLAYNLQTILFARSRRSAEIILTYLHEQADSRLPDPQAEIRGFRSGYLPARRRQIERGLRQGEVRAVVATNALELGIDIGGLSAALLVGYPGSIAAVWQQAGRAGRGEDPALAVLIATADPLDQYLARHPEYFFARSPEQCLINPDNLLLLLSHLRCAAFELPFQHGDGFGSLPTEVLAEFLDVLRQGGELHYSTGRYFWMAEGYPAQMISLRSASPESVLLQVSDEAKPATLGQVDLASAAWMVHPGAVYLHEGQSYLVESLDLAEHAAVLRRAELDYFTEPAMETTLQPLEIYQQETGRGADKVYGDVQVTSQLVGYRKVQWNTHITLAHEPLTMPPSDLVTTGYWFALHEDTVESLRQQGVWRGDANDYGPRWNQIREQVRARDGYRCQACGAQEQGRTLDVHHKIPFRAFRGTDGRVNLAEANRLDNLVALCHTCHRRVEAAVRIRSGLSGLSFALSRLAPLFLMCAPGDLGAFSDPQAPLADGAPAVALYDMIPAGIGFSQRLYELHDQLLAHARGLISACPCADGCPSCVGPGGENGEGGKSETLTILEALARDDFDANPLA